MSVSAVYEPAESEPTLVVSQEFAVMANQSQVGYDRNHPEPVGQQEYESVGNPCYRWLVTINSPLFDDDDVKQDVFRVLQAKCKWYIWCREVAPTTGHVHWHMYIILFNRLRINQVSNLFGLLKPHLRVCDENHVALKKYIMKDGNFQCWGTEPYARQVVAAETKKKNIQEKLEACKGYDDFLMKYPDDCAHYRQVIKDWYSVKSRDAGYCKPRVVWIYGETGTGKSALAYFMCGTDRFRKVGDLQWFDGYVGQKTVTFDDFRACNCKWDFLLNMLDHYKVDDMPVKGGFVAWRPELIVFTSPKHPRDTFMKLNRSTGEMETREDVEQIIRRIDVIIQALAPWTYVVQTGEVELDGEVVRNWIMNERHE